MAERDTKGRWKKGQSANPSGRPKGIVNHARLREAIADDVPEILQAMAAAAKGGDAAAARLLLDRCLPALKPTDTPIRIELPDGLADASKAVIKAATTGEVTPGEASSLLGSIGIAARVTEVTELLERIEAIEQRLGGKLSK